MSCTRGWRTTSRSVKWMKAMPSTPRSRSRASTSPEVAAGRQVDLGHVAGDHRLGAEAQAGQKHLHLLGGGVLGLVQDDEGVVQGAAPHEGQGRHLDDAPLYQLDAFSKSIMSCMASYRGRR